jgi:hypothetical protein
MVRQYYNVLARDLQQSLSVDGYQILNLGVCIMLRVLDQVQGFPFNATPFQ